MGIMQRNTILTTTTFSLPNHHIVKSFTIVRGIVVRSRSIIGSFFGGLQTIFGGNISIYTNLCERTRADAYEDMIVQAKMLGANAIIGVRYDSVDVLRGVTEVLCYGTAVLVEPIAPH